MSTRIERTVHALHDLKRRQFLVVEEIDVMERHLLALRRAQQNAAYWGAP